MPGEPWDPIERDRRYASCKRAGLRRLISEGDSWFDYPPHPNIIDWLDGEGLWAIKRFEKSGDTVDNMARPRLPGPRPGFGFHSADIDLALAIRARLPMVPLNGSTTFRFGTSFRASRLGTHVGWAGIRQSFLVAR